jgi:hypothetical protein
MPEVGISLSGGVVFLNWVKRVPSELSVLDERTNNKELINR